MSYMDNLKKIGLEGKCYFVSKKELPDNLKRRLREFSKFGMITLGPIEVKKFEVHPRYYKASFILHRCIEDEQGAHSFSYNNFTFNRYRRK